MQMCGNWSTENVPFSCCEKSCSCLWCVRTSNKTVSGIQNQYVNTAQPLSTGSLPTTTTKKKKNAYVRAEIVDLADRLLLFCRCYRQAKDWWRLQSQGNGLFRRLPFGLLFFIFLFIHLAEIALSSSSRLGNCSSQPNHTAFRKVRQGHLGHNFYWPWLQPVQYVFH